MRRLVKGVIGLFQNIVDDASCDGAGGDAPFFFAWAASTASYLIFIFLVAAVFLAAELVGASCLACAFLGGLARAWASPCDLVLQLPPQGRANSPLPPI